MFVTQSCPTLYDPMDCKPPGSPVHGILQARILEWVVLSFSNKQIYLFIRRMIMVLYSVHVCVCVCTPSCPALCDRMNCSPPDSSLHEIFQARILEWVVISYCIHRYCVYIYPSLFHSTAPTSYHFPNLGDLNNCIVCLKIMQ